MNKPRRSQFEYAVMILLFLYLVAELLKSYY